MYSMCCWVDTQRSKEIKKKNKMKDDRQVEMICINSGTKKSLKYMKREKKKIFPSSSSFLHNQLLVKRLREDCGRTAAVTECASIAHGSTWWMTHTSLQMGKTTRKGRKKETTYWTLPQQLLYTEHVTTFHWLDFPFLFLRRFKFQTKRPNWAVGGRPGVTVWLQIGWFFFFSTLSISSQPSSF